MKLRTKISLLTCSLVIIVIVGMSVVLFVFERRTLIKELHENQLTQVTGLAGVAEESQISLNDIPLLNYLDTMKATRGVSYALFMNNEREVLAHTDVHYLGALLTDSTAKEAAATTELLKQVYRHAQRGEIEELALPVMVEGKRRGTVRMGFSKEIMDGIIQEAMDKMRTRILYVALGAFIIGIIGSLLFARTMTKPIKVLAKGAETIGEGKLEHRINITTKDELGGLAKQFNEMAVKLQELDQMKDDFVSSVSHELRSPLTAIKGYVNFILEGKTGQVTDKQKEFLTIVANNTTRLGNFINNVLDLAKIEAGMMEIKKEPMNLPTIADEIVTLLKPLATGKKINLGVTAGENVPEVVADPDKMRQVITNLVNNALKFTPEGGSINVEVKNFEPDSLSAQARNIFSLKPAMFSKDGMIMCAVKDTGIGIPEENLKKVFSKFEQVKGTREKIKGPKGTGLGLAIVKGIIAAHEGMIWVESIVNKGTSFKFVIPKKPKGPEEGGMKIF